MTFQRFCVLLLLASATAVLPGAAQTRPQVPTRPNVLFIAVDDLRPEGRTFNSSSPVETPNIDRLARRAVAFRRAYVQQAVCSPSRTSLLTGRRPDSTRIFDLQTHFRLTIPDVVTLPQHFKAHGYHTQGLSKIYHGGLDDPASWSAPHWTPSAPEYGDPALVRALRAERDRRRAAGETVAPEVVDRDPATGLALKLRAPGRRVLGPAWEAPDVPDGALKDGETADKAIALLQEYKDKTQPFFLAVGLLKPHLPFVAPKRYYDRYPLSSIRLPSNYGQPENAPRIALTNWGELRGYRDIPPEGPLPEDQARQLIRAYYASTTYADAQIGKLLDALDRLKLRDNTIVVLWGDHGWHLGEQGLWCKHTNFENATRAPLLVSAPAFAKASAGRPGSAKASAGRLGSAKASAGKGAQGVSNALVEFVDIYPTLTELAGLPRPDQLEGVSLVPLLTAPDRPWKRAAFSQYPRAKGMGYSMRTDRYRYTEWPEGDRVVRELYDHHVDPGETRNVADAPEHAALVRELSAQLRAGWRKAVPST